MLSLDEVQTLTSSHVPRYPKYHSSTIIKVQLSNNNTAYGFVYFKEKSAVKLRTTALPVLLEERETKMIKLIHPCIKMYLIDYWDFTGGGRFRCDQITFSLLFLWYVPELVFANITFQIVYPDLHIYSPTP